jgi:hypothetical protein
MSDVMINSFRKCNGTKHEAIHRKCSLAEVGPVIWTGCAFLDAGVDPRSKGNHSLEMNGFVAFTNGYSAG